MENTRCTLLWHDYMRWGLIPLVKAYNAYKGIYRFFIGTDMKFKVNSRLIEMSHHF